MYAYAGDDFLTTAICDRCKRSDSYYATEISGNFFVLENCNSCGAEGQFFLKIVEA